MWHGVRAAKRHRFAAGRTLAACNPLSLWQRWPDFHVKQSTQMWGNMTARENELPAWRQVGRGLRRPHTAVGRGPQFGAMGGCRAAAGPSWAVMAPAPATAAKALLLLFEGIARCDPVRPAAPHAALLPPWNAAPTGCRSIRAAAGGEGGQSRWATWAASDRQVARSRRAGTTAGTPAAPAATQAPRRPPAARLGLVAQHASVHNVEADGPGGEQGVKRVVDGINIHGGLRQAGRGAGECKLPRPTAAAWGRVMAPSEAQLRAAGTARSAAPRLAAGPQASYAVRPTWKPYCSTKRAAAARRSASLRGWSSSTGQRSGAKRALPMGHSSCGGRRSRRFGHGRKEKQCSCEMGTHPAPLLGAAMPRWVMPKPPLQAQPGNAGNTSALGERRGPERGLL